MRMRMMELAAVIGAALMLVGSEPAGAENRVENGGFDVDLAGWTETEAGQASRDEMDWQGPGPSGSAHVTTLGGVETTEGITQCITATGGALDLVEVQIFVPSEQTLSAAAMVLQWWDEPDCPPSAQQVGEVVTTPIQSDDGVLTDEWVALDNEVALPAGAMSATVLLGVMQLEAGDPGHAFFDAVFVPEPQEPWASLVGPAVLGLYAARRARPLSSRSG